MQQIQDFLESNVSQWQQQRYVLAVSGGVDSMVLLHQFATLFSAEKREQLLVVHINHQLRAASIQEEKLVQAVAQQLGIKCCVYHWEQGLITQTNVEAEARAFRYQQFATAMQEWNANYLVLAHHGDDQVETMLMKSVRASTLSGLAGMRSCTNFARGFLLRPFLTMEKQTLINFAQEQQIAYLEDESNHSNHYTRNRYRHQIIPLLKKEQPRLVEHFQQNAQLLQDCLTVLQPLVSQRFEQLMTMEKDSFQWNSAVFCRESAAMQRLLLQELSEQMQGILSAQHCEAIQQAMNSERAQLELHLPHQWRFYKIYDECSLVQGSKQQLSQTQEYIVNRTDEMIQLSPQEALYLYQGQRTDFMVEVALQDFPLRIRHRKAGDQLVINQQGQHQSMKRWCINQKIPSAKREQLWLVETNKQKIIAILGYRRSQSLSNVPETDKIRLFYRKDNEV